MEATEHFFPPAGAAGENVYAGFWHRAAAAWIDGLILLVPSLVVRALFDDVAGYLLWGVCALAYEAYFVATAGATPGRRAVRIRVVTATGAVPGWLVALVRIAFGIAGLLLLLLVRDPRHPVLFVACAFWLVDVVWMNRDERWQTLHDRLAGTYVVRDRGGF